MTISSLSLDSELSINNEFVNLNISHTIKLYTSNASLIEKIYILKLNSFEKIQVNFINNLNEIEITLPNEIKNAVYDIILQFINNTEYVLFKKL